MITRSDDPFVCDEEFARAYIFAKAYGGDEYICRPLGKGDEVIILADKNCGERFTILHHGTSLMDLRDYYWCKIDGDVRQFERTDIHCVRIQGAYQRKGK